MTKKQGTANLRHLPKYHSHLGYFIPTPQKESPRTVEPYLFYLLSSEHTYVLTKYSKRLSTYCGTATCLTGMTSQTSTSCKYTIMVESTVYLVHWCMMCTCTLNTSRVFRTSPMLCFRGWRLGIEFATVVARTIAGTGKNARVCRTFPIGAKPLAELRVFV